MYSPKDTVAHYLKNLICKIEGWVLLLLITFYTLVFIFFDLVVLWALGNQLSISNEYRIAFALMPILLIATFLRMDMNANSYSDRLLTVLVLLVVSSIPIFKIYY